MTEINQVTFTVETEPVACARPRFNSKTRHAFTPKKTRQYKDKVASAASKAMYNRTPLEGPLKAEITAYMAIPEGYPRWKRDLIDQGKMRPTSVPDTDNLAKGVMDAMNKLVFRDDAEIIELLVHKRFSDRPRMEVCVESLASDCFCSNLLKKPLDYETINKQGSLL